MSEDPMSLLSLAILIKILAILFGLRILYELIVAPTLRLKAHYELFSIRDDLLELKAQRNDVDERHFEYLLDTIDFLLSTLPEFKIGVLKSTEKALARDPQLRLRGATRLQMLEDCPMEELSMLRKRTLDIGLRTVLINSGAWGLFVIPAVVALLKSSTLATSIKSVLSLPSADLMRVAISPIIAMGFGRTRRVV